MIPGSTPSTPASAQLGTSPRGGGSRMEAAVAGPARRGEHRRLPFETEDAAPRVRLAVEHARVVHQVARREVVGAVDDDVERLDERAARWRRENGVVERLDANLGVERLDAVARRLELRAADVGACRG